MPAPLRSAGGVVMSENRVAKTARGLIIGLAFIVFVELAFRPPLGIFLFGVALGALYGLLATGIILIYRTNRIINFAAAALGAAPAIAATLLQVLHHMSYWLALPMVLLGSALLGAFVDVVIIRRFSTSPRLIVTVATLGISQILAFVSIYIPVWLGSKGKLQSVIPTPWHRAMTITRGGHPLLNGDHIFALIAVFAVSLGLAAFFRYTRMGIALRASAENADRASLLGIPVRRVGTVAWTIAAVLGGLCIFLRAPLVGVPVDGSLGYAVLVYALAAAVIAKMENIPVALFAGMAVGVLEQASVVKTGSNNFATAMMLVIILGALLLQRKSLSRALDAGVSTWQSVKEFRPIPTELRKVREVVVVKVILGVLVAALFVGAPYLVGASRIGKLTLIPIYAMVAISLVILTGWAGQISLGQYGIVGVGAAVAGGLAANHNIDFFAALFIGTMAGAGVSVLIGIPALRVQGLYLAVTTLAFAAAVEGYLLRPDYFGKYILPKGIASKIARPYLWGRINVTSDRAYYYLTVVFLMGVILIARSFRQNRSGRVLIAVRDNQRAAPAYSINLARNKLAAFAVSGGIAAMAGVILAYQLGAIDYATYGMTSSVNIFVYTVVGGLTSIPGAVAGSIILGGLNLFGDSLVKGLGFLSTGVGVLFILLFLPGGFAEGFFKMRDSFLRWVANRHDILVPSLVADRRVEDPTAELDVIEQAELAVEEVDSFDVIGGGPSVTCPVCGEVVALAAAPEHEHLRGDAPAAGDVEPELAEDDAAPARGGARRLARAKAGRR
jgi:branched-chain amino acid transport system permease protein